MLRALTGNNRGAGTIRAYTTDLDQFIAWLHQNNVVAQTVDQVDRSDITEYLAHLADRKRTGVSRARKLAAIREYFRFLADHGHLAKSPTDGVATPRWSTRAS